MTPVSLRCSFTAGRVPVDLHPAAGGGYTLEVGRWSFYACGWMAPLGSLWWRFGYRGRAAEGRGRALRIPSPWGTLRVERHPSFFYFDDVTGSHRLTTGQARAYAVRYRVSRRFREALGV